MSAQLAIAFQKLTLLKKKKIAKQSYGQQIRNIKYMLF